MKTLKQILETVEAPKSEAERHFIKKHIVHVDDKTYGKLHRKSTLFYDFKRWI